MHNGQGPDRTATARLGRRPRDRTPLVVSPAEHLANSASQRVALTLAEANPVANRFVNLGEHFGESRAPRKLDSHSYGHDRRQGHRSRPSALAAKPRGNSASPAQPSPLPAACPGSGAGGADGPSDLPPKWDYLPSRLGSPAAALGRAPWLPVDLRQTTERFSGVESRPASHP
jgi:hypothetical protein